MFPTIKASIKLVLLAFWISAFYPITWLLLRLSKNKAREKMVMLFNCGLLKIIGVQLKVVGKLDQTRPLLLVSNHISYLDIPILASVAPFCFTPKSEIASWPLIGGLARLADALFVDRRPDKVLDVRTRMEQVLVNGRVICLFPEATTGNGKHLLPFKSSFFSLAEAGIAGKELAIQPAAIIYTHINGLPIGSSQWPEIAWFGDMELQPHAWSLFKLGPIRAELHYLSTITASNIGNRKKLANHCFSILQDEIIAQRHKHSSTHRKKPAKFNPRFLRLKN